MHVFRVIVFMGAFLIGLSLSPVSNGLDSQGLLPQFGLSIAQAEGDGGGDPEPTIVTIGYNEFRNALRTRSVRGARTYLRELKNREDHENIQIVISGFSPSMIGHLRLLAYADPSGTANLLRDLDGVSDIATRRAILQAALQRANNQLRNLEDNIQRDRRRGVEPSEGTRLRARAAAANANSLDRWQSNPEEGTLDAGRTEN